MKRTNQNGVLITTTRPGGPSGEAKPPLTPGDVLVEAGGKPMNSVQDLQEFTRNLIKSKSDPVPVVATFEREARRYLTVVRVGTQELRDPGLEVAKAWLPVEAQVISRDVARALNQPNLKGFYITQVYPETTAEKAGLRAGDFLLAVDKEQLTATNPEHDEELEALIRQYDIGTKVELKVLRGNTELKVPVELMRSPKLRREMKNYRNDEFEFTVRDISFIDAAEERWKPEQKGVLVEEIKSGSWAELASLRIGDLIIKADGQEVENVDSLRKIMERVTSEKKAFVVMQVKRGIHTAFLEFEPTWKNK
jgi:S1-C subfamily serine protease